MHFCHQKNTAGHRRCPAVHEIPPKRLIVQRKTFVSDDRSLRIVLLDIGAHRQLVVLHQRLAQQRIFGQELIHLSFGDLIQHGLGFSVQTGLFAADRTFVLEIGAIAAACMATSLATSIPISLLNPINVPSLWFV